MVSKRSDLALSLVRRRRPPAVLALAVALVLGLAGCEGAATEGDVTSTALVVPQSVAEAMADNRTPAVAQDIPQSPVTVELAGADTARQAGVDVSGQTVSLTQATDYHLSGRLDGQVVVDVSDGVVHLTLEGVTIESDQPGALIVEQADQVVVHLAAGSVNRLADAGQPASDQSEDQAGSEPSASEPSASEPAGSGQPDGTLFSRADLLIDGPGELVLESAEGDALVSNDGLVISDGQFTVTAGDDAIRGKDYLVVQGGQFDLTAGGDALKSTNDSDPAAGYIWVSGGTITAQAATDCLDAASDALISGGELRLACGDDGVHADQAVVIDQGSLTISQSYEGLEGQVIVIAGGELAVTASDDAINASDGSGAGMEAGFGGGGMGGGGGWGAFPGGEASGAPGNFPGGGQGAFPGADASGGPGSWPGGEASAFPGFPDGQASAFPGTGGGGGEDGRSGGQGFPGGGLGGFPGGDASGAPVLPGGQDGLPDGQANAFPGGGLGGCQSGGATAGQDGGPVLSITGGVLVLTAGGDGLDSNGTATMSGGQVTVYGPTSQIDGAIDAERCLVVTGGTLAAFDNGGMSETPGPDSTQPWLTADLGQLPAGSVLAVRAADTTVVASYQLPKAASLLVFTDPALKPGAVYTITDADGAELATATATSP
ncbi:MAG: carbohydrate-binding domain-containing protein [Propionibacteriaceae bacterium]|nr:carbohydrate-binding domain-containing protein [Propionibacteriaceae bacterium]